MSTFHYLPGGGIYEDMEINMRFRSFSVNNPKLDKQAKDLIVRMEILKSKSKDNKGE